MIRHLISSIILVSVCYNVNGWKNDWDKLLHFSCPSNQAIDFINSIHDNKKEDRRWDFGCRSISGGQNCKWTGYVNNWDETFSFQCPGNGYITGVVSYHDNKKEDRRHKFKCCSQKDNSLVHGCYNTGFTKYDKPITKRVPSGYVWRGVTSQHNNKKEDRIFNFMFCRIGK